MAAVAVSSQSAALAGSGVSPVFPHCQSESGAKTAGWAGPGLSLFFFLVFLRLPRQTSFSSVHFVFFFPPPHRFRRRDKQAQGRKGGSNYQVKDFIAACPKWALQWPKVGQPHGSKRCPFTQLATHFQAWNLSMSSSVWKKTVGWSTDPVTGRVIDSGHQGTRRRGRYW